MLEALPATKLNAPAGQKLIVLMPAYCEAERIAASVNAARTIPGVTKVVVVDDGSTDATADLAEQAGAEVLRLTVNAGKGAALRAGLAANPGAADDIILLLDADLGDSASEAAVLLPPLYAQQADMTLAQFPVSGKKAGFGLVKGLARWGTWLFTRQRLHSPISGQRACRRWVLDAAPIADGYGVEVSMNIAAGDAGARIIEVPVTMTHNASGRDFRGFLHRGQQFTHLLGAFTAALFGRNGEAFPKKLSPLRLFSWLLFATLLFAAWGKVLHSSAMRLSWLIWLGIPLALLAPLLGPICSLLLRARKKNFSGRFIPALGGFLLLPVYLSWLIFAQHLPAAHISLHGQRYLWCLLYLVAWLLLGVFDDLYGDARRKGLRGHLRALYEGKFTTGNIKLLAGGVLALLTAGALTENLPLRWLALPISALLIALSANAVNLFDLRPGRALKICWLVLVPLATYCLFIPAQVTLLIGSSIFLLLWATFCYAPFDLAGMIMLGDSGANPLGALQGMYLTLFLPLPAQTCMVLLLILLHVYAEKASLTKTIERTPWLRWLDNLGR